jgi:hypothetical protein
MRRTVYLPMPVIRSDIGLGDVVKKFADHFGIKLDNCNCESRRKTLNRLVVLTRIR